MSKFTESEIEIFSLDELKQLGFSYIPGVRPLRPMLNPLSLSWWLNLRLRMAPMKSARPMAMSF